MNIIDISRDALKTEIYPGDPLPHAEFVSRIRAAICPHSSRAYTPALMPTRPCILSTAARA